MGHSLCDIQQIFIQCPLWARSCTELEINEEWGMAPALRELVA